MIVPMKKVFLLCLEREREAALERLAALGAVQIEESTADGADVAAASASLSAATAAEEALAEAAASDDPFGLSLRRAPADESARRDKSVRHALEVADRWLDARAEATSLEAVESRFAPWGEFDPDSIRRLEAEGVPAALFSAPVNDFDEAAFATGGGVLTIVSRTKDTVYGAYVGAPLPDVVSPAPLPAEPLRETRQKLEKARSEMRMAHGTLRTLSRLKDSVAAAAARSEERLRYETAAENFRSSGPVAYLTGWVPGPAMRLLERAARESGWGFVARDPEPDEEPPVLLKTPRALRPIHALFRALGILPAYRESDPSVVFYAFFTVFFAMLVGDAGYGALLIGAWWLARRSMRRRTDATGKAPSEFASQSLSLLLVFGVAAAVWGVLSGTYFGMPAEWLPRPLASDLPTARWLADQGNVMHLCFIIGLLHLGLARVWNAVELMPDTKALAQIGWLGILYGMYNIVCKIVVPGFVFASAAAWSIAIGVALVLLFSYKRSELKENAVSLAMTPLNVVSSMGDVISYVRLFAVGLASVQIARQFDTMAVGLSMPLWAKLPCMALILLLGHALNLAMGALSILVHAVRLNTLEFSGAKGVTWSGSAYEPFVARKAP